METKRSIKAVAVVFFGVSLVGLLLSLGATGTIDPGVETDPAIVQGP